MFDETPADLDRVGAHRSPARSGRGWVVVAWAALAAGVLTAGGIVYVSATTADPLIALPHFGGAATASASPTPTATYRVVTDPTTLSSTRDASVTILNGTADTSLQTTAARALRASHWKVVSLTDAGSDDVDTTVVYYRKAGDIGLAYGIAELLGVKNVSYSADGGFSAAIAVVIGSDYTGETPASTSTPAG